MKCTIRVCAEAPRYAISSMSTIATAICYANQHTEHRAYNDGCHEFDYPSKKAAKNAMRIAWNYLDYKIGVSAGDVLSKDKERLYWDAGKAKIV